ncbi:homogentisate phytyltransferase [Geitlerinema sp. PCC 9228]|jgi:homogentisate phytyltransferase/homogentisate geranylgeranyltransferase|uniref:homogentisate phytyltransferase n=1 Tax=Geitlerinema sp. PCC 9228 TaxID=111611 RepID=UPI0008F9C7A2|nr:homogentisate phytyltransferase [Geitlerinema sp. PCC 9228]
MSLSSVKTTPWWLSFWKFSRPHTIIGTSLSVVALYVICAGASGEGVLVYGWRHFPVLLGAWLACLCGNIYIVGLNQLQDVEIDRVNKPHLPLAAAEFSLAQGRWIVAIAGILAIATAAWQGVWLLATVGISLMVGTAYSLPPVRLKRFPFWASVCIFSVRGVIVNLGLFLHFHQGFPVLPPVWLLTFFILVYTFAIAIFKDIPDTEGDRQYHIATYSLRLGAERVFELARWAIGFCYLSVIVAGGFFLPGVNPWVAAVSHAAVWAFFWWRSSQVDLADKAAVTRFYQFIWKLFYVEYILFPVVSLPVFAVA